MSKITIRPSGTQDLTDLGLSWTVNGSPSVFTQVIETGDLVEVKKTPETGDPIGRVYFYDLMSGAEQDFERVDSYYFKCVYGDGGYWNSYGQIKAELGEPEPEPEPEYIIKSSDIDYLEDNHSSILINGVVAKVGDLIVLNDLIEVIADDGYFLNGVSWSSGIWSVGFTSDDYLNYKSVFGVEPAPAAKPEFWFEITGFDVDFEIIPIIDSSKTNIYVLSDDDYIDLISVRLNFKDTENSKFLLGLLSIPFKIPDDFLMGETQVVIGDIQTQIVANKISQNRLNILVASFTTEPKYNNVDDYKNFSCVMHVPYSDPLDFEVEHLYSGVDLVLSINPLDGVSKYMVFSRLSGDVVASVSFSLGDEIPLTNQINNSIELAGKMGDRTPNEIITPYVELIETKFGTDNIFNDSVENFGKLQAGYSVVDFGLLNFKASEEDKRNILEALKLGVFINE